MQKQLLTARRRGDAFLVMSLALSLVVTGEALRAQDNPFNQGDNPFGGAPAGGAAGGDNPFGVAGAPGQNPFGGAAVPGQNPFGAGGAMPAGGGFGAAAPRDSQPTDAGGRPADESDPVLLAIQESKPVSAEELVQAAKWLIQLGRYEDAKTYLKQAVDGRPERETLFALERRFGSSFFVALRREPRLAPEGDELGRAVLIASNDAVRSPERLNALIAQLGSPKRELRTAAVVDLRDAGEDAVAQVLAALADPARESQRASLVNALPQLGPNALPLLLAALDADSQTLPADAATALGRFGRIDTAAYLMRAAFAPGVPDLQRKAAAAALTEILRGMPSQSAAKRHLSQRVSRFLRGDRPLGVDPLDEFALIWEWNDASRRCVPFESAVSDASWLEAARLAKDLLALGEPDAATARLCWTAVLGAAHVRVARGEAWDAKRFDALTPEILQSVLRSSLENDQVAALITAARLAGLRGQTAWLQGDSGRPSVLVQAAMHAHPEVRFEALQSIMVLDDGQPYAGSSHVLDAIRQLVTVGPTPRILVGDPRSFAGQGTIGLFSQEGFEGDWAPTGKELFRMAAERGDYDLVLVADILDSPPAGQVIQWLRADPRTAGLRVVLLARSDSEVNPMHRRREEVRRNRERIVERQRELRLSVDRVTTELEAWDENQLSSEEVANLRRQEDVRAQDIADGLSVAPRVKPRLWKAGDDVILDYGGLFRGEWWANDDPLTWVFPQPHSPSTVAWIISETSADGTRWPDSKLRMERAALALRWLDAMATSGRGKVYDLFRCQKAAIQAAWRPALSSDAIRFLGRLGDNDCQRTLVDLASDGGLSKELRLAAVQGLRDGIERRGLLLTRQELKDQYRRLKVAQESSNKDNQQILQQVLSVIEAPTRNGEP